jgi:hypothetical protein
MSDHKAQYFVVMNYKQVCGVLKRAGAGIMNAVTTACSY